MSVMRLFNAVMDIDNATLPLSKYVIRLEVAPPGQEAMMIKPTLKYGSISVNSAIPNPIRGSNRIWRIIPVTTAFGRKKTFLKSVSVTESPIPNVIRARDIGRK